ncbi:hypothetical protein FHG87_000337 [Trinorchestia longiramus]|nr:hypothetical protein FHG87_000337 [Trinorchestia longiramus]
MERQRLQRFSIEHYNGMSGKCQRRAVPGSGKRQPAKSQVSAAGRRSKQAVARGNWLPSLPCQCINSSRGGRRRPLPAVARRRFRWFGAELCSLVPPHALELRHQFLNICLCATGSYTNLWKHVDSVLRLYYLASQEVVMPTAHSSHYLHAPVAGVMCAS